MIDQRNYSVGFDDTGKAVILNPDGSPCAGADLQFLFDVGDSYREQNFSDEENDKQHKEGYVYLMAGNGYCKIGKSKDVQARHRQLGIKMPFPIQVEHYIQCADMHSVEEYWHHLFREKRLEGEWFNLTEDDISLFRSKHTMHLTAGTVAKIIMRREAETLLRALDEAIAENEKKYPEFVALKEEYGEGPFESYLRGHLNCALALSEHLDEL